MLTCSSLSCMSPGRRVARGQLRSSRLSCACRRAGGGQEGSYGAVAALVHVARQEGGKRAAAEQSPLLCMSRGRRVARGQLLSTGRRSSGHLHPQAVISTMAHDQGVVRFAYFCQMFRLQYCRSAQRWGIMLRSVSGVGRTQLTICYHPPCQKHCTLLAGRGGRPYGCIQQ